MDYFATYPPNKIDLTFPVLTFGIIFTIIFILIGVTLYKIFVPYVKFIIKNVLPGFISGFILAPEGLFCFKRMGAFRNSIIVTITSALYA